MRREQLRIRRRDSTVSSNPLSILSLLTLLCSRPQKQHVTFLDFEHADHRQKFPFQNFIVVPLCEREIPETTQKEINCYFSGRDVLRLHSF